MRIHTKINLIFKSLLLIIAISIIVLIYLSAFSVISLKLENETIILTFVGILATFIILNNHSQVDEVKDNYDRKIKSLDDVITSILSSIDPILDKIATALINKGSYEIEALNIHKEKDKFYFDKIKVRITIENNKVVCKNIENGEILKSITLEGNGGLYNLETDKLHKIYKFYKI